MKNLIILLSILWFSVAHANEDIFFLAIPSNVTNEQAITSLYSAALKREWTIKSVEDDKLQIKLDHRGYKALLDFSITDNVIKYSDHTTYYNEPDDEYEEGAWEDTSAPKSWIKYLLNDTNALLAVAGTRGSVRQEDIETKLENLKALFDKKLITEEEYKLKRKELISEY